MPLLFSSATHNALAEVKAQLVEGKFLFAYLDDNSVSAKSDRIRTIYDVLGERLFSMAGIELHTGKTRTWNRTGVPPRRIEELGPEAWSWFDIKILGTPVGNDEFVQRWREERIRKEEHFWEGDRLGSRSPVRMAYTSSMCWSLVSQLREDITAQSVSDNERCGAPVCTTGEAGQEQGTVGRSPFRFDRRWGGDSRPVSPGGR